MTEQDADLETIDLGSPPPPPPPPGSGAGGAPPEWPEPPATRHTVTAAVVGLVAVMIAVGVGAFAITSHVQNANDNKTTQAPSSPGITTPRRVDPDASVLTRLGVQQVDVGVDYSVQVIPNGDEVAGTVTLDLCNGTYPSESLRTARLQVVEVDGALQVVLSTEAVLYRNPAATAQAFNELRGVAKRCPNRPVASPSGGSTLTTKFNPAPDSTWPRTAGVDRLAYDINTVDAGGARDHSIVVYLRRGRAFLGVYFPAPDGAQPQVAGRSTIASIVELFQQRLAALPASVVNRG